MTTIPIRSEPRRSPDPTPAEGPGRMPACGPLPALAREAPAVAARFRRWSGRSGRRYLVSVYGIGECPDYADAVVLAVGGPGGALVWLGETGPGGAGLQESLAAAAQAGAGEAHVLLGLDTPQARRAAIRDLDGRH